jgi:hypothetical protein
MATHTPYRATGGSAQPPGHGGLRSFGVMSFFALPPPEIGPVLSAESTLSEGVIAVGPVARAFAQIAGAVGGAVALAGVMSLSGYPWLMVCASVLAGVTLGWLLGRHVTTVHPVADFVGVDGVAIAQGEGSPDRVSWRVLRFADAATLRGTWNTSGVRILSRRLVWCAFDGREVFSLNEDVPRSKAPWSSFAVAAEAAWTRWRLTRALDANEGRYPTVVFPMREGRLELGERDLFVSTPTWEGTFDRHACAITADEGRLRIFAPHAPSQEMRCALDVWASDVADLGLLRVVKSSPTVEELLAARVPGEHPALKLPPREPTNNRGRFVLALLGLSLLSLVGSVALTVTAVSRRQRVLLVDNPSLTALDVSLDRKPVRHLGAGRHRRFELGEGRHTILARSADGRVETLAFTVPPRRHPAEGWYGLWRAAGVARYAVVTVVYGADERPAVRFVGEGERLVALDDPELFEAFDEPFSREERVRSGTEKRVTHLCRVVHGIASGCGVE